jgi:spoIIIJ-associated protein
MNWEEFINNLIKKMGFNDFSLNFNNEHLHCSIFIHEAENLINDQLQIFVESINKILKLVAEKNNIKPIFVDINNYQKKREELIIELARAAAKKAVASKQEVFLPPMNSYERRLAHIELMSHPEVTTESQGKGKNRFVIVKPINPEK